MRIIQMLHSLFILLDVPKNLPDLRDGQGWHGTHIFINDINVYELFSNISGFRR